MIDFAACWRDCHCGWTLEALILGDPLALNVRLETEISGQVEILLFRHRSANWTIEIERGIVSHLGFFTAFRPAKMVKIDHLSWPDLCSVVASTSSRSESARQHFKPPPPNDPH